MEREKIVQTAGRDALGSFAPDFARYNDDVLFGEVWNDMTLDLKTKSIIVISVFMGRGWYQEEGKEAVELTLGKVVNIPVGVKHWHGAASDSWMSHLAFEIPGEDGTTEWCEPVSDKLYGELK